MATPVSCGAKPGMRRPPGTGMRGKAPSRSHLKFRARKEWETPFPGHTPAHLEAGQEVSEESGNIMAIPPVRTIFYNCAHFTNMLLTIRFQQFTVCSVFTDKGADLPEEMITENTVDALRPRKNLFPQKFRILFREFKGGNYRPRYLFHIIKLPAHRSRVLLIPGARRFLPGILRTFFSLNTVFPPISARMEESIRKDLKLHDHGWVLPQPA